LCSIKLTKTLISVNTAELPRMGVALEQVERVGGMESLFIWQLLNFSDHSFYLIQFFR